MDPCGMIMDWKRTCYDTKVRLNPGGPLYDLKWFFCNPKAKPFPGIHFGLSREWYNYRHDFGEDNHLNKRYSKGKNVGNRKGQCFVGQAEWFRDGVTPDQLANAPPQRDPCTSCPTRSPTLGIAPPFTYHLVWRTFSSGFPWYPFLVNLTVYYSIPAGLVENYLCVGICTEADDFATYWRLVSPGNYYNYVLIIIFPDIWIQDSIFAPTDYAAFSGVPGNTNPLQLDDPVSFSTSTTVAPSRAVINSPVLIGYAYLVSKISITFFKYLSGSTANLGIGITSTVWVGPGTYGSGFDGGYSAGFGGPGPGAPGFDGGYSAGFGGSSSNNSPGFDSGFSPGFGGQ
jgi:hypothetical protein